MELIERQNEVAVLHAAMAGAQAGRGGVVLVCGEAGIGKTTLLKAAIGGGAQRQRLRVLWGGCEALFSPRPLGPLYDMAAGLSAPVRQSLRGEADRNLLFGQLLDDLGSPAQPTVLVLEDVHWADAATLDVVKFLGRRIASLPALLVLSFRDDELGDGHPLRLVLGDLPAGAVRRLVLPPLSEQAVQQLMRRAHVRREGLYAATHGNPFMVTECLRAEGVPPTVSDAVLTRASRQPAEVRALLELASIVPGRIEKSLVEALLAPAPATVEAALASGLLTAQGLHFAFRHELGRIALEQSLPSPRAMQLHAQVLAQLERGGSDVPLARLVHHAGGAGDAAAVLRLAPLAARQAASLGAHREAVALYAVALGHRDRLDRAECARLLEEHATLCYMVEQPEQAIAGRRQALDLRRELGDVDRQCHNLRWLSRVHWVCGRNAEAHACADQAIAMGRRDGVSALELGWALSNRAQLHMLARRPDEAARDGLEALRVAQAQGDAELEAHAKNNVGTATWLAGDPHGYAMLEDSLRIAQAHGLREHTARALVNLIFGALCHRDYAQMDRWNLEAQAFFQSCDMDQLGHYIQATLARGEFERGRWEAAQALAEPLVLNPGTAKVTRLAALAVLARLRLRMGGEGALPMLEEATTLALGTGELERLGPAAAVHAEAYWLGARGASLELVRRVFSQAVENRNHRVTGELALWLRLAGESADLPAGGGEAPALALQAGRWREAASAWDAMGCGYEAALALVAGGDAAGLGEALQRLQPMKLPAVEARCRELMRQQGVRGVPRGPRPSTAANPAGLTRRETEVLQLLVQGLTDAQIASRLVRSEKTVNHHVSSILSKLDVRTRTEASVTALARGLVEPRAAGAA